VGWGGVGWVGWGEGRELQGRLSGLPKVYKNYQGCAHLRTQKISRWIKDQLEKNSSTATATSLKRL